MVFLINQQDTVFAQTRRKILTGDSLSINSSAPHVHNPDATPFAAGFGSPPGAPPVIYHLDREPAIWKNGRKFIQVRQEVRVKKIALALVLLVSFGSLHAETRYVTDELKITMRSGESATHKIIRMLPSGTPLEVLADNKGTGYSQVRTEGGTTGYVLTRQLMAIPSARERLESIEQQLLQLKEEPERLSARLISLQTEHDQLQQQFAQVSEERQTLGQELESLKRTAANAIRISNERNELRKQVVTLTHQVEDLKQENRELGNSSDQRWFMIGAAVIVGGILLGLILPHLRVRKRKNSWGSF
jgi:SH3 domain protein